MKVKYPRALGVALAILLLITALVLFRPKSPAPIKIGVLHSLTGTMAASEAPLVDALRLAAEEINGSGGLLGRPLQLVVTDGRSDWEVFAQEADRLIREEKVDVLFACWTSACRKAVKAVVERHRHLMFYPVQYEGLEQSPNIVYTGAAPNQQVIPGTHWALDTFGKRVYLVGSDYIFPRAANFLIRDLVVAAGGRVLAERYAPLGAEDFEAIGAEIRRLAPDVILNTVNGDSNRALFRAMNRQGLKGIPVLSFSLAEPELQAFPEAARHPRHYAVWGYFQSLDTPTNQAFVRRFKSRFGQQRVISDPVEASYNGLRLWANAVKEAASLNPATVNRAIGRQSVAGPAGPVALDASTRHLWRQVHIGLAQENAQFRLVSTTSEPVRPAPYPAYRSQQEWQAIVDHLGGAGNNWKVDRP